LEAGVPSPDAPQPRNFRKNVAVWRGYNARRWAFEHDSLRPGERLPFVCECTSGECLRPLELTADEWRSAHARPDRLTVLPRHVMPDDAGTVVEQADHFWVVQLPHGRPAAG
jgi:hypothetical protein